MLRVGGAGYAAESEGAGLGVLEGGQAGGRLLRRWAGPSAGRNQESQEPGSRRQSLRSGAQAPTPAPGLLTRLPPQAPVAPFAEEPCRPPPGAPPAPSAAMVAGMLMALDQLRAIYEVLFREGVMVAKKDRRPRSLHPHVPGVTNLQVMRAMASLRARGLVRETFAWRHFYWYLTNEGVAHLRQYLHLPPEIVPASLQRVRRPVAMVTPARRAPHVQAVQGPLGCPPKRGHPPPEDPVGEERRVYRRKQPEEGAPEPPVVPAATPGTLARPGPEPAPATGQLHPGPSHGEWEGELGPGPGGLGVGVAQARALLPPAGGALCA